MGARPRFRDKMNHLPPIEARRGTNEVAPAPSPQRCCCFALVFAVGSPAAQLAWIIPAVLGVANEALLFYARPALAGGRAHRGPWDSRDTAENWTTE